MRKFFSLLLTLCVAVIVILGLSSVLYPPLHGAVLGYGQVRWWELVQHGQSPLTCGGSQRMTIKGDRFQAELRGAFPDALISAGGDCKLTLIDCDLSAPTVLSVGGNAMVLVEGGRLHGTKAALSAGGNALVKLRGTKIVGKVSSGGSARLVGVVPGKYGDGEQTGDWHARACDGVVECYSAAGFVGNVAAKVIAKVNTQGQVTDVAVEGEAPAAVRRCLVDDGKKKHITDLDHKPGKMICSVAGSINGGSAMVSTEAAFQH